jgi:hypothetical protein
MRCVYNGNGARKGKKTYETRRVREKREQVLTNCPGVFIKIGVSEGEGQLLGRVGRTMDEQQEKEHVLHGRKGRTEVGTRHVAVCEGQDSEMPTRAIVKSKWRNVAKKKFYFVAPFQWGTEK